MHQATCMRDWNKGGKALIAHRTFLEKTTSEVLMVFAMVVAW